MIWAPKCATFCTDAAPSCATVAQHLVPASHLMQMPPGYQTFAPRQCAGTLLAYALPASFGDKPAPPIRLPYGHTRSVFSISFSPSAHTPMQQEPLQMLTTGMDRTVLRWAVPLSLAGPDWRAAKVRG